MRPPAHTSLFASHAVSVLALLLALNHDGGLIAPAPHTSTSAGSQIGSAAHSVNRSLKGDRLIVTRATPAPARKPQPTPRALPKVPVGCEPPFSSIANVPAGEHIGRCVTSIGTARKTAMG